MGRIYHHSKQKIVLLLIFLSLILALFGKYKKDLIIKSKIIDSFQPFLTLTSAVAYETKETLWAFFHFYKLKAENEKLTKKISHFEKELVHFEEIKAENQRLCSLLDFKSQLDYEVIPARIIGQDFTNWYNYILINKGTKNGVHINQAVLSNKGIVGKIVEVFKNSAKIMLLTNKNSQIGGIILTTRDIGILQGIGKDHCLLNYLSRTSELKKGDLIITSAFDSLFPKGFLLGVVNETYSEDFGLYKYATVIPAVDFSRLEEVFVIKNFKNELEKQ